VDKRLADLERSFRADPCIERRAAYYRELERHNTGMPFIRVAVSGGGLWHGVREVNTWCGLDPRLLAVVFPVPIADYWRSPSGCRACAWTRIGRFFAGEEIKIGSLAERSFFAPWPQSKREDVKRTDRHSLLRLGVTGELVKYTRLDPEAKLPTVPETSVNQRSLFEEVRP
jgi:hypothetical protein